MTNATTDLLTLRQAAQIAGLSPVTLRGQAWSGRLEAQKVGRDWLVSRQALADYVARVKRAD